MSDFSMMNDAPLTGPTLLLDNGSRRMAVLLALPGTAPSAWPRTMLVSGHPVDGALEFLNSSRLRHERRLRGRRSPGGTHDALER